MDEKRIEEKLRSYLKTEAKRAEPSSGWWDDAVSRLGDRKTSFWERYGAWLNRPLWRAVVPVAVVALVVGALWGTGVLPGLQNGRPPIPAPSPTAPVPEPSLTPVPGPSLGIVFNRIPDVISPYGEQAKIELSFTNQSSEPRTMTFPPKINIIALPDVKPPDIIVRSFSTETKELELAAGQSVSYSLVWDQKDDRGQQVSPGWYSVEVTLATSRGSAARVLVLPPEGAMEKTIEVNQSLTVNGITFTLERVELTATGMKVYAFNTPQGYNLPQGPMLPPPMFMMHAEAEYSIDGGIMKQTFPSAISFLDTGVEHTWSEYLDPVPKNAKELTFRITKLSGGMPPGQDWEGPWEFKIPLN